MIQLTPEQARARLENNDNLCVIINEHKGVGNHTGNSRRKVGDVKTINEKELIANLAIDNKLNGTSYKETGEIFGIAGTTVSDYVRGAYNNSPVKNDEKSIRKPIMLEERISSKALDKLVDVLDKITDEKMDSEDANDLASIAVKMATVNEKINGNNKTSGQVVVNIFPPKILQEKHFDIITVEGDSIQ